MKCKIWLLIFTPLIISSFISCEKEQVENLGISTLAGVWELDKFIDKNNNVLIAPNIQISFLENNCVTVFTNYNYGQGEFSIKGNKVTVRNLALSEREFDLENDNRFVRNLTGSYLINGDSLKILSDYDFNLILLKTQKVDPYQCDLSTLLIDTINSNKYYSEDIFDTEYSSLYGKWFVYSVYGGFGGGEYEPLFDFLEVKKNGIYGISKCFYMLEYGKMSIERITPDEKLVLEFIPNDNFIPKGDYLPPEWSYISKRLSFSGNDTIVFQDYGCLDCYRYSFIKIK